MTALFAFPTIAIAVAFGIYCLLNYPLAVVFAAAFFFFAIRN